MSSLSTTKHTGARNVGASRSRGPFAVAALDYYDAGIGFPIPIAVTRNGKRPIVKGFTGYDGAYPDRAQVRRWVREYPRAAIGLRLPPTVLGLDLDMYDGKAGRASLTLLIGRFGQLPPTWISTSRDDGSGIYLFNVADSNAYQANPAPGIETIRACHRFVTVWPSLHSREGRPPYRWFGRDRRVSECIPTPEDLPALPVRWVVGLPKVSVGARDRVTTGAAATGWLSGPDKPCPTVAETYAAWRALVVTAGRDGGAYDTALRGVHALLGDAEQGHRGAARAVRELGAVYMRAVRNRRDAERAEREYNRHAEDEIRKRKIPNLSKGTGCAACRFAGRLDEWRGPRRG